jgi:hypothetical protein
MPFRLPVHEFAVRPVVEEATDLLGLVIRWLVETL